MQRRQVLAALGALLSAGCLGAKRPDTASGVRTEGGFSPATRTPVATPEPTPEPTETPTPEPTETPEPTPTDGDVEAGAEAVDRVQSAFTAAVEAYTGSDDGSLSEVSVTSSSFDVRAVLLELDTVQSELAAAEAAATTDDQRDTVADLQVAETFLTQSSLAHSYFIESIERLDVTYNAFPDDTDTDDLEAAENRFDTSLDRGSSRVSTLKNDVDAGPVAVAEPFDDDTYDETVSLFESVRAVLQDASSGLDRMIQGLDELEDAYEDEADDDDEDAADRADEARELFDEAYDRFDDAADKADDMEADALHSRLESLRSVANDRYIEADDLYADVS